MKRILIMVALISLIVLVGCVVSPVEEQECRTRYSYPSCVDWCNEETDKGYNMCLTNCEIVDVDCEHITGMEVLENKTA